MRASGLLLGFILLLSGCQGTGEQKQPFLNGAGERPGARNDATDGDAVVRGPDNPSSDKPPAASHSPSHEGVVSQILGSVSLAAQFVMLIVLAPIWIPACLLNPIKC